MRFIARMMCFLASTQGTTTLQRKIKAFGQQNLASKPHRVVDKSNHASSGEGRLCRSQIDDIYLELQFRNKNIAMNIFERVLNELNFLSLKFERCRFGRALKKYSEKDDVDAQLLMLKNLRRALYRKEHIEILFMIAASSTLHQITKRIISQSLSATVLDNRCSFDNYKASIGNEYLNVFDLKSNIYVFKCLDGTKVSGF
ncbi:hypothetical protein ENBRE01_1098 [Enteropsectra breve]|nr:hypothetical protein ENBRE01_1098 [Enteropsectra breve]